MSKAVVTQNFLVSFCFNQKHFILINFMPDIPDYY